jgi:hypothetical protein
MTLSKQQGWMESYNRYYRSFLIAKTAQISQARSQKATQKEETNWIDMGEIKQKMEELGRRIRRQILPEFRTSRRPLGQDDVKCVFQHLMLAANVLEPPKRRDWGNLPIRKLDGTFYNEAAKALYEEFGNQLVEKATDTYVMVLKTFKTAKKFGQQEFELPKRLSHYIQRSIELVPRAYFVTLLSDLGQPMGDNYWTQFIREIPFSKGRHLTTNHLRHDTTKTPPSPIDSPLLAECCTASRHRCEATKESAAKWPRSTRPLQISSCSSPLPWDFRRIEES